MMTFMRIAGSVWLTSTMIMLAFFINAELVTWRKNHKLFSMPFSKFVYYHFCPIVHTIKCIKILNRWIQLRGM